MAATMEPKLNWSKPPVNDEYREEDVEPEELKILTTRQTQHVVPSSPTLNSKKRKVDDWDSLD